MNFGGHLEKFGGQNPKNSKKQGGHGKPWLFVCGEISPTVSLNH